MKPTWRVRRQRRYNGRLAMWCGGWDVTEDPTSSGFRVDGTTPTFCLGHPAVCVYSETTVHPMLNMIYTWPNQTVVLEGSNTQGNG